MGQPRRSSATAIIAVLGYCGGLVSISQTVSLPLLPILPDALNTSVDNVSWVATSSFLTGAIANPVLGRLGDMYGKRRMMLLALVVLAIGCLTSAIASNLLVLVLGRAMQGCGMAVIPLGMSIAKETLPPDKTSHGVALVSATLGIGSGIGLPLAGVLVGWFDWHSVFWVNAALAVIAVILVIVILPAAAEHSPQRFDVVGAVWLSAALVAILLPLSKSASWGWLQPLPLALYLVGFAGLIGWYRYEHRPARPLVDVRLMRERPLMIVNGAGLLLGFAMFSNMFGAIVLLQTTDAVPHGFGASVVLAGMVMLPGALAMMVTSPVSAWITDHIDARTSLWVGAAIMALGYAARPAMLGSMLAIGISVGVVNAGVGIAYGAMPSAIMAYVPDSETASANSIGALTRATGASLSSAAVAAILSGMSVRVGGSMVPSLGAFQVTFIIAAVASFGAAFAAYQLPRAGGAKSVTVFSYGAEANRP
ncbi:MAG: MFS transporter [Acidimicrobiia bacterium]